MARAGMDPEAVESVGRQLAAQASRLEGLTAALDQLVHSLAAQWHGADASAFAEQQWPAHRAALRTAGAGIRGLGTSLLANVADQRGTSAAIGGGGGVLGGGVSGGGGAGGVAALAAASSVTAKYVHDASPSLGYLSKSAEWASEGSRFADPITAGGRGLSYLSIAADGWEAGESFAKGEYVDGSLYLVDGVADSVKTVPGGYLPGVAIATWAEVGREAEEVDWSPQGLQQIRDADLSDWAYGLEYAAEKLPEKLFGIFAP